MKCDFIRYAVCPICGKNFIPGAQHVYKIKHQLACSWGCLRKHEKETEAQKKKKGRGKNV